ncbi:hypothetical protein BELL_0230g00020 [Botrytis elliptica]|uniref:Uncharacterized protein n=1 Tax=Botrytis elliptica TaxID=278938 RepID=A0A4Z1K1M3_9HELO|nr:hypothetical protein BELL_0230g00020 [Botrytis elliptica]
MDDRQEREAGSGNLSQTDILGHDINYSRAKREFLTETSADTSETGSHPRKKRKVQPWDFERSMQDGVAACINVFNASSADNNDAITHSNADRSHKGSSNGMDTCSNRNEKPRWGVINFWRVEGKKDLAHFVLRPLPRLDWGIGEDPTLGSYEGPLLTLVEKRWPKNKGDKVICVVEKAALVMDELEEYMSTGLLWTALVQEHLVMKGSKHLLIRGKSKNEKVKEDNIEEKLNDAEFVADFEKELIDLDYAGLDIAPLGDDHPIFELFEAVKDEFSIQWHPWEWMRST